MRRMQGFSMIELMVAMGLGLLISAAAIQLFLANQISLNFQRGMNDVQANGRFAIDQMVHDIRVAGLGPTATAPSAVAAIAFEPSDIANLAAGSTAVSSNDTATAPTITGLLKPSDQLVVQYIALAATVDCEGNDVAANRYVVARYFVRIDNGVPSLACDGSSHDGTTLETAAGKGYGDAGAVLLSGVDSFQVLYGVDDKVISGATNGKAQIVRYVNAATYAGYTSKPTILALRLGLYLHSQERAGDAKRPSNDIQVLDSTITAATVPDDGFLRRLFITTVSLRNVDLSGV